MATIMNVNSDGTGLSIGTAKAESNKLLASLPVYLKNNHYDKLFLQNAKDGDGHNVIWFLDNSEKNGWSLRHDLNNNTFMLVNKKNNSNTNKAYFKENLTQFTTPVQITSGQLIVPDKATSWTNGFTDLTLSTIKKESGALLPSAYFPLFSVKTSNGHHISLGGIGDQFGIFGRKSSETANGYNYALTLDVQNGYIRGAGQIMNSGEIISTNSNAFRMANGTYGAFFRIDSSDMYLLLTNSGNPYGTFNSYRPFRVNLSSGVAYLNGYPGNVSCGTGSSPFGNKGNIYIQY